MWRKCCRRHISNNSIKFENVLSVLILLILVLRFDLDHPADCSELIALSPCWLCILHIVMEWCICILYFSSIALGFEVGTKLPNPDASMYVDV